MGMTPAAYRRGPRWAALRQQALRRDGYACVKCGAVGRLEVDHILSIATHPTLAYEPHNLQTLCSSCHASKTVFERGFKPCSPQVRFERRRWRELLTSTKENRNAR